MLTMINHALPDLSPSQQRVGHWILKHPKEAANATLARLERECNTSEPTAVRFCRHLGLAGFRELTIRLTESLSQDWAHPATSPGTPATNSFGSAYLAHRCMTRR
jgi:DNA-binding MurR/RpiR family transcriptional regulator